MHWKKMVHNAYYLQNNIDNVDQLPFKQFPVKTDFAGITIL